LHDEPTSIETLERARTAARRAVNGKPVPDLPPTCRNPPRRLMEANSVTTIARRSPGDHAATDAVGQARAKVLLRLSV
jgi:hypothetical protein